MESDLITHLRMQQQIEYADLAANVANASIADVAQVMHRQHAVIRDLSVAVGVLSKMLIDSGAIDAEVLRARIQAGIEDAIEDSKYVVCRECRQSVPTARTNITMTGPVCDTCAAKG